MTSDAVQLIERESPGAWFANDQLWLETFEAQFPPARYHRAYKEIEDILG